MIKFGFKNADCVLPGAGAFEIAAYQELMKFKNEVKGRARLGKNRSKAEWKVHCDFEKNQDCSR